MAEHCIITTGLNNKANIYAFKLQKLYTVKYSGNIIMNYTKIDGRDL
jgi:hypothetical protein